jgi:hypothetical protein
MWLSLRTHPETENQQACPSSRCECDYDVLIGLDHEFMMAIYRKIDDCEAGYRQESINRSSRSPTYFLPFEHCLRNIKSPQEHKALKSTTACTDLASA